MAEPQSGVAPRAISLQESVRAVALAGGNGVAIVATSPEGSRRHVKNSDHGNGFIEVWVYEYLE